MRMGLELYLIWIWLQVVPEVDRFLKTPTLQHYNMEPREHTLNEARVCDSEA